VSPRPLAFDEAIVQRLERSYRARDIVRRRALVHAALDARPGERVLDVGCGPGFYVAELLERVGPSGSVVAVDASADSLALARARCEGKGAVAFHQAEATALPVGDADVDAALSVQVLEYVTDVDAALAELHRALRPGGRLVLWDIDWATLSWHSRDPERMARVLLAWEEHLADPGLPLTLAARLRAAGFVDIAMTAHAFADTSVGPDTYVGAVAPLIAAFVAERGTVTADEAEAWSAEQAELDAAGEAAWAMTQSCFTATRT
jgi:arsenite methyltransferase